MTLRQVPYALAAWLAGSLALAWLARNDDTWIGAGALAVLVVVSGRLAFALARQHRLRAERLASLMLSPDLSARQTSALLIEQYPTERERDYAKAVLAELLSGDPLAATARAARLSEHVAARKSGRSVKR